MLLPIDHIFSSATSSSSRLAKSLAAESADTHTERRQVAPSGSGRDPDRRTSFSCATIHSDPSSGWRRSIAALVQLLASPVHSTRAKARFKDVTECVPSALVSPSSGIRWVSPRVWLNYMGDLCRVNTEWERKREREREREREGGRVVSSRPW